MASQTIWKRREAAVLPSRSPSPPPHSCVDWFADADVSEANSRLHQRLHSYKKRRRDGLAGRKDVTHGRFVSHTGAMDALASTALSGGSTAPPQHRHSASINDGERPSKRIRSDTYWSSTPTGIGRRPTTSYEQSSPSQLEDAELLMNFFNSARSSSTKATSASHFRSASFGANVFSPSSISSSNVVQESLPQYQSDFQPPQSRPSPASTGALLASGDASSATPKIDDSGVAETSELEHQETVITDSGRDDLTQSGGEPVTLAADLPADEKAETKTDAPGPVSISKMKAEANDGVPSPVPLNTEVTVENSVPSTNPLSDTSKQTHDRPDESSQIDKPPQSDDLMAIDAETDSSQPSGKKIESAEEEDADAKDKTPAGHSVGDDTKEQAQTGTTSSNTSKASGATSSKTEADDAPQVCAACNFHRNNLTLETENEATSWISCDGCNRWFHFACAGFKSMREVRSVDKFRCKTCKPIHGPTTYVRKSARAHAPIDYAELNQGVVKTSEESPEHHYIKPIKEGSIKFTAENFARIRPELVTADFWLRGDGMKEPVVIPSEWNPRPKPIVNPENGPEDAAGEPSEDAELHDHSALEGDLAAQLEFEQVQNDGQDLMDMVIPQGLTVRRVAELYGPEEKIEVIDVKSQNGEDKRWNMRKWADYYESNAPNKPVRNVISLEVSQSPLGRLIRRPRVVRDLDLQDSVWPSELVARGDYPKVQFYCLMSVADCYTDFHIDFGGSSVYYHILKGKKTFFFIPPTDANLKKYEDWCNSEAQNYTFLGDQTKICYRVDLGPGDTMLIPAGWIHAVWTPEDSLVIGGNFLTRQNYSMQIRVTQIEKATKVPLKFRYPYFQKIMWYTMVKYMTEDPIPRSVVELLTSGRQFERKVPLWDDYNAEEDVDAEPGSDQYNARYYAKCELDGLPELVRYLQRTAYIVAGFVTEGVSSDTKRAVQRSIPKEYKQHGSEPVDCVRRFAIWAAWKRGNETIPHWAYPDHVPELNAPEVIQKKLSAAHIRRLEREAAMSAQRVSDRPQREKKQPSNLYNEMIAEQEKSKTTKASSPASINGIKPEPTSPAPDTPLSAAKKESQPRKRRSNASAANRQPACETCRKGRRACKHREGLTNGSKPEERPRTATSYDGVQDEIGVPVKMEGVALSEDVSGTSPNVEMTSPNAESSGVNGQANSADGSKEALTPGRAKACVDCRKSKRRCIHDEFGRQDPIKMAQVSQSRPAAKKKRNSDGSIDATFEPKTLSLLDDASPSTESLEKSASITAAAAESTPKLPRTMNVEAVGPASIVHPATQQPTPIVSYEVLSQVDDESLRQKDAAGSTDANGTDEPALEPVSALVSPPESTHTDHERTASPAHSARPGTSDGERRRDLSPPTTVSEPRSRRTSQIPLVKLAVVVPTSPNRARSRAMSTASVDSSKMLAPLPEKGSVLDSADEDTKKLIHEMMAQDRGLRTRRESRPV